MAAARRAPPTGRADPIVVSRRSALPSRGFRRAGGRAGARIAAALLVALVLSAGRASAQALDGRFLDRAIDSIAAAHLADGTVAGLTVGVMRDGVVLHHRAYGYADLELAVRTPLDAVYQVGSVTKQFTAVLALQLAGEGVLDLEGDIRDYLPDLDTGGRVVPVRRLLDHTSGMKGYTEMAEFGPLRRQRLPRDTLVRLVEAAPWNFEPGEALIYNNSGYFLMGLILEEVTGEPYASLLQERIFEPAGMNRSHYCSNTRIVEDRARGYAATLAGGMERAGYLDHLWPYAAGSVCSTARDLLAWNHRLHRGEVLEPRLYRLLITPEPLANGMPVRYAKGIAAVEDEHGTVLAHGGGIDGFLTAARHYPDHDLTVVVLQNTASPDGPGDVSAAVVDLLLPVVEEALQEQPFPGDAAALAGRYEGPVRGGRMAARIEFSDGELRAFTWPVGGSPASADEEGQRLRYVGEGRFTAGTTPAGGRIWFVDAGGRPLGAGGDGPVATIHFEPAPSAHYVLRRQR